jgi:hypothetical protein
VTGCCKRCAGRALNGLRRDTHRCPWRSTCRRDNCAASG